MKYINIKYINLLFVLLVLFTSSCSEDFLDLQPYDKLTSEQLLLDEQGMRGLANGNLMIMKDLLDATSTNNVYVRVLFQVSEFPSDNVLIVSPTTDPLWLSFNRLHVPAQVNVGYLWEMAYKIILNSNTIINGTTVDEETSDIVKQYLGEAYFHRAMAFFDLARLFSFPPSHGLDNNGIILRTEADEQDFKARATVGETYDQIISDFNEAAKLMTQRLADPIRYGSNYAAFGFLSRAHLFTEEYQSVIDNANKLLDGNSRFELDSRENYINGLQNSATSSENIFILYHTDAENRGSGAIGSMYNDDGAGWGEIFPSKPFYDLISKYPNDVRNDYIIDTLGTDYLGTSFENIFMTKFSYQGGVTSTNATLHSPILMRLSEVLLNRAEAYAHLDRDAEAIADVNAIRARAGLTGAELVDVNDLAAHGYSSVLDAVLTERRIELCFEGHRRDDLMRNKIDLDRSFASAQNLDAESDIYPFDGPRQIYYIPSLLEIAYNPLCVQNK